MKILAIDSTALVASVALCEDEKPIAEFTVDNGNTHSETLLPMVEKIFTLCGISADDVDLFAVAAGPGSFTGVRIGVSTVKGIAFGTGKPCIGVSTLEALARRLNDADGLVCPVMNARRKQVYTALFRCADGKMTRLMPDSSIAISELDEILAQYHEPVRLCGDGYDITFPELTCKVIPTPVQYRSQSAYPVAQVALDSYRDGVRTTDRELVPTYLRLSQAERERMEKETKNV